jgi:hypothetical protein
MYADNCGFCPIFVCSCCWIRDCQAQFFTGRQANCHMVLSVFGASKRADRNLVDRASSVPEKFSPDPPIAHSKNGIHVAEIFAVLPRLIVGIGLLPRRVLGRLRPNQTCLIDPIQMVLNQAYEASEVSVKPRSMKAILAAALLCSWTTRGASGWLRAIALFYGVFSRSFSKYFRISIKLPPVYLTAVFLNFKRYF